MTICVCIQTIAADILMHAVRGHN